jgi:hypothetical protein
LRECLFANLAEPRDIADFGFAEHAVLVDRNAAHGRLDADELGLGAAGGKDQDNKAHSTKRTTQRNELTGHYVTPSTKWAPRRAGATDRLPSKRSLAAATPARNTGKSGRELLFL